MALTKAQLDKINKEFKSGAMSARDYGMAISEGRAKTDALDKQVSKYKATTTNPIQNSVVQPETPIVETPVKTEPVGPNYDDMIKDLYSKRTESAREEILSSEDRQMSDLKTSEEALTPQYRAARTQEMTKGQILAKRASDFMKASGYDLGSQVQRGLQIGGATQAGVSALTAQEQQARTNIGTAKTDLKAETERLLRKSGADLSSQELETLIAEKRRVEDIQREENRYQTEAAKDQDRYDQEIALRKAGLTGSFEGMPTLDKQTFDKNIALLDQQLEAGKISNQEKLYALEQMKDPNSAYSQLEAERLKAEKLGNKKLSLQIQDLMEEPITNPLEEELRKLELEAAIKDIKEGPGETPLTTSELEKESVPYSKYIDDLMESYTAQIGQRSPTTVMNEAELVKAATPQIINYLQNLENSGIDEKIIDHLLTKYGLSLGK